MTLIQTANALIAQGVSCIPIKPGLKIPDVSSWAGFVETLPDEFRVAGWFDETHEDRNIAAVGNEIQCMDFDVPELIADFIQRCEEFGLGEIVERLIHDGTPSAGDHLIFRSEPIPSMKLAMSEAGKVMIETRGKGGYFVIPPSRGYTLQRGDFANIPVISKEDRDLLIDIARSFDESTKPQEEKNGRQLPVSHEGLSPLDDFDATGDVSDVLTANGWTHLGGINWRRPGKEDRGLSATLNFQDSGMFYVFSSNADHFEPGRKYLKSAVYAILEHAGDFRAAAIALKKQGYGESGQFNKFSESLANRLQPGGNEAGEELESSEQEKIEAFLDEIEKLRFDQAIVPPADVVVYYIKGKQVCTQGNLSTISAAVKTGKSAICGGFLAATMTSQNSDADCLGVSSENPEGKAVVYIDTEQSRHDFWHLVNRARIRADVETVPAWLYAYPLAGKAAGDCCTALKGLIRRLAERHGGIHSVFIDGVADLVSSVNDEAESNRLVAELHGLAIEYHCPILSVIHTNPITSRGQVDKTRGHLGSQLERKSETNLKLEKTGETTLVWSNKQRKAPITKEDGPVFKWCDQQGMHMSCDPSEKEPSAKEKDLWYLAQEAFLEQASLTYTDLCKKIKELQGCVDRTAKRKVADFRKLEIVKEIAGRFSFVNRHNSEENNAN